MEDGFDEHLQHVIRRREIHNVADDPDLQDQKGRENYRDNAHEYSTFKSIASGRRW